MSRTNSANRTYRMPAELLRRLKELADREKRSVNQMLVILLEKAVNEQNQD